MLYFHCSISILNADSVYLIDLYYTKNKTGEVRPKKRDRCLRPQNSRTIEPISKQLLLPSSLRSLECYRLNTIGLLHQRAELVAEYLLAAL